MDASPSPMVAAPLASPLYDAYLHDFPRVREFFSRPPCPHDWLAEETRGIQYDPARRARVADVLERQNLRFGAGQKLRDNVARLRAGAFAVVTGQQVGLLGGPLFAILKAITAVRLADEASRSGVDCVPVFWLATEDHDLAEVNHVTLLDRSGVLQTITASSQANKNAPVGEIRFGSEINSAVDQAAELLGDQEIAGLLRAAYHPGAGYGEAFARLFARIFRDFGVILLDAGDPGLRRIAAPIYAASIRQIDELEAALRTRGEALRTRGFHEQVKVTSSSTLLFALQDGARVPIHRAKDRFVIGDVTLDQAELLRRIEDTPQHFSPNVLLRPVAQDYLLPTLAYVGGPAEIAYFAQAAVVYKALLGRVTPALPRLSVTLVEPHIKRILDLYGLTVSDVFVGEERLRDLMAERTLPSDLTATFEAARRQQQDSLRTISEALGRLDPTLVQAAAKAGAKMRHQIDRLHTRTVHAEFRRNVTLARHASLLSSTLYPGGNLQERMIGGVYFLARHPNLLRLLNDTVPLDCLDHQVVFL